MERIMKTNNTIFGIPFAWFRRQLAPTRVELPAGTEAQVCWGEIVFSPWGPSRRLTRQDVIDAESAFLAAGCGSATADSAARRWVRHYGEEFAPMPGGRPVTSVSEISVGTLATAKLGEEMSLPERRPGLLD